MYIESAIQKYQPKPGDFELRLATGKEKWCGNYGVRKSIQHLSFTVEDTKTSVVLEGSSTRHDEAQNSPATLLIEQDEPDGDRPTSDSPLGEGTDVSRGWFPTLQKTLWLLSKLYQCVQVNQTHEQMDWSGRSNGVIG